MLVGSVVGGYGGARLLRRMPGMLLRRIVIVAAAVLTAYLLIRTYR
jgi:uncharacterized membrane protein YfcA